MRFSTFMRSVGAAALTAASLAGAAHGQEVGRASAVNPAATANMRTITIGASIAHKERIKTEAAGSVQLLFVDKTSMTIGPNSDLTIDEYVYNPNAGTGKLAATLGKGALRFVGGQISHSGDAEIKTSSAVIGIRGGVALITPVDVYAGYGTSTVRAAGATVTLGAGEFTHLANSAPPTVPGPPPAGFVASLIQTFQSSPGQTGGVGKSAASPANVARAESKATGTQGGAVAGSLTPAPALAALAPVVSTTNLTQTIQTSVQEATLPRTVEQPVNRPAVTLTGFVGGIDSLPFNGTSVQSIANGLASIILDPAGNRVQADFTAFSTDPSSGAPFRFGSVDPNKPADSDYPNYDNFSAKVAEGAVVNTIPTAGSMSTLNRAETRTLATNLGSPNLTICECEYTRWGLWQVRALNDYGRGGFETINGTWVAGRATTVSDMPTTGQATYAGHVLANIQNQSSSYMAAGDFSNTVDFGARTGRVNVTNLDHTNYAGTIAFLQSDPRNFAGSLQGDSGNRQMGLLGSFFRSPTSPVGEMGGSVVLSGRDYLGSGIFAAAKK